ncbi:MAG: glycosyltransferase family 39 protein [Magnetospirillum sp.]|nr:glycosyltransferase family 39 protein [Magnetospirillum sp.]
MDRLTQGFRPYLLLSLLCLVVYGPGLASVPPLDRDESRFIQATRQMMQSGDYVRIQFQDEMRAKKPVGAYWLQAAAVEAFSHPLSPSLWPYRLPGALAAWAAVVMTFGFGQSLLGRRPAFIAAILLATAVILVSEAHQAKTDAVLLACVVAAQGTLARFYVAGRAKEMAPAGSGGCAGGSCGGAKGAVQGPGLAEALLFWVAQGVGILIKGPMVPVISLLTIAGLGFADRRVRWFVAMRPLVGAVVAAAIAAPWFVAISHATGGAFVGQAIKSDLLPKLLGAQESHGAPPGYYTLLAALTFWPGSLFLWPAMVRVWAERHRLAYRFLLAWALPAWAMFELVPTKLPHYVLPVFPALALMTGGLVAEGADIFRGRGARIYYAAWSLIGVALAAAAVALPIRFGDGFDRNALPAAVGIVLATLLPVALALKGRVATAALALSLTAAATFPAVLAGIMPGLDRLWVSRQVAAIVDSLGVSEPVASAGFSEPSLVVLLGTHTRLTDGGGAARHLAAHPDSAAAVAAPEQAAFLSGVSAEGLQPQAVGHVVGFNYSRGKPVDITIYQARRK